MSDLKFVSFSDDGSFIILENGAGEWIEVSIKETSNDAQVKPITPIVAQDLTPREIQSRIRSGISPSELSSQTGTDLARIMIFAPPVLQERAYVAQKASGTIIRKASGTGPLIDVVIAKLSALNIDEDKLEWDAFRREDGRWTISLSYPNKETSRKATWLYDARNSALVPSDEEARWLIGESAPKGPTATQPTQLIKVDQTPRLKVVPAEPEPAVDVDDLPEEKLNETKEDSPTEHPTNPHLGIELEKETDDIGLVNKVPVKNESTLFDKLTAEEDEEETTQRPKLPSWDEILFGTRKKD